MSAPDAAPDFVWDIIYAELYISAKKEWVQFSFLILLNSSGKTFNMSTWLIHLILNLKINLFSL